MRKFMNNNVWICLIAFSITMLSSCQKVLDINTDPNNQASATPELILPTSQVGLGLALGGWNFTGSIWGQYWTGGQGVGTSNLENYNQTA